MGFRLPWLLRLRSKCASYSSAAAPAGENPVLGVPPPGAFRDVLRGAAAAAVAVTAPVPDVHGAATAGTRPGSKLDKTWSGAFRDILRGQVPDVHGTATAATRSGSKVDKISSGALHLIPMPNSRNFKPYRSTETIPEFFAKMAAAIKVGGILRDLGWSRESQQHIEKLGIAWTPLVVTQVLRQPLSKESAWEFFQWLKTDVRGYRHTQYTYNSMLEAFGRAKDVAGMQKVLEDMTAYGCGMNVVLFTTVIRWYYEAGDLDKALGMWNQMVKVGCQPNVVTYTMLMSLLAKEKRFDKVGEMFKDMLAAGVKPNVRTYNVLLGCLAAAGHKQLAVRLFEGLPSMRAAPTATTFRVMMEAAAVSGDLELLRKLYDEMRRVNRRPNCKMYFGVMDSLRRSGKLDEAGDVLRDLEGLLSESEMLKEQQKEQVSRPGAGNTVPVEVGEEDNDSSSLPLQDLEVMEGLDKPLVDMKAFSTLLLRWDPHTPAALEAAKFRWDPWKVLRVLMGLRDPYVSLKFFYWVEKQPGYKHDSFVYTKMISILARTEHFKHLDDMLDRMQREKVEISLLTMNSLIETLAAANKPWHALKMHYWMKQGIGVKPDARTYTTLIEMLAKSKDVTKRGKALEMYQEMLEAGCRPDSHTYTVIIQFLGEEGKLDAAMELFENMPGYGCQPNSITYTALIQCFVEAGMVSRALLLFKRMQQDDGVKPNWLTFKVLAVGLKKAGMRTELSELDKIIARSDLWWKMDRKSVDQMPIHEAIVQCLLKKHEEVN